MAKIISDYGKRLLFSFGWRKQQKLGFIQALKQQQLTNKILHLLWIPQLGKCIYLHQLFFNVPSGTTKLSRKIVFVWRIPDAAIYFTRKISTLFQRWNSGSLDTFL